jgi:hypothetical protein
MPIHRTAASIAALGAALGLAAMPVAADPRWGGLSHGSRDQGHWERATRPDDTRRGAGRWRGDAHERLIADHGPWHHQWGDGDIRHFRDHDWDDWHNGFWVHSWNDGFFGWWFVVSGVWFWYPVPVYPFPDPYIPPTFIVPPPPPAAAPAVTPYWYYCPLSNGYYPYITTCPAGWHQVLATPDAAGPPDGSAPPPYEGDDGSGN